MIEQNILGLRSPEGGNGPPQGGRRALSWPEIIDRLRAARDLRRELGRELGRLSPALPGSFAPDCARRLSGPDQGIQGVNPIDSGNRKANGRTVAVSVDERSPASRGAA